MTHNYQDTNCEDCHGHDPHASGGNSKKRGKLVKLALVFAGIIGTLILLLVVGLVVLFAHFISIPSTNILQAISESWQSALNWAEPFTNLYEQTLSLIPSSTSE